MPVVHGEKAPPSSEQANVAPVRDAPKKNDALGLVAYSDGPWKIIVFGGVETLTVRLAEVTTLSTRSYARATSVYGPFATCSVSHVTAYGAVESTNQTSPLIKNSTFATPVSSLAAAEIVVWPPTVEPAAGAVRLTDGAFFSAASDQLSVIG